ncbi:MAG: patatin-like phospholipase family protein, partial [Myxococcales bacterium]|nr:patatin-like phospholipase family protein [Myxococcales bacterium]
MHLRTGEEKSALDSVHSLFELTRETLAAEGDACAGFAEIAATVLNEVVRPFTAKWHGLSEQGAFARGDSCRSFRRELLQLQPQLRAYQSLLASLVGVGPATERERVSEPPREEPGRLAYALQLDAPTELLERMEAAERSEVLKRRAALGLKANAEDGVLVDTVGLSFSGGGIRSATFALGVVQALAARDLLREVDFMSTVSGGGYLGTFLSSYLDTDDDRVGPGAAQQPFAAGQAVEAPPLRHLRNHSKYLMEGRWLERMGMFVQFAHGALINMLAMLPVLLALILLAFLACWAGLEGGSVSAFVNSSDPLALPPWSLPILAGYGAILLSVPLTERIASRPGSWMRERGGTLLGGLTLLAVVTALVPTGLLGLHRSFHGFITGLERMRFGGLDLDWELVGAGAGALLQVAGGPLLQLASRHKSTIMGSLAQVAALGTSVLFLLLAYLGLFEWLFLSEWAVEADAPWRTVAWVAGALAVMVVYAIVAIDINLTSPHRTYRDRLCRAYLLRFGKSSAVEVARQKPLSQLGSHHKSPYHLINCTLNVPGSENLELRGRRCDFFIFSKHFCGSPVLGYEDTSSYERRNPALDLGTAMAISGAAAGPLMGTMTIPGVPFLMTMLNVRLGYWLRVDDRPLHKLSAPGLLHLLAEISGQSHERQPYQNLSDGG